MEQPIRLALVVDDDPTFRKLMRVRLQIAGWRVAEAADGISALGRLREDRPQLVLLDLRLPGVDGFEVAYRMRVDRAGAGIRIIMVTSDDSSTVARVARENGCDGCLTKPVDGPALLAMIETVMDRGGRAGPPAGDGAAA